MWVLIRSSSGKLSYSNEYPHVFSLRKKDDDLAFYTPFNIYNAISWQGKDDNERLCGMNHHSYELHSAPPGIQARYLVIQKQSANHSAPESFGEKRNIIQELKPDTLP